MYLSLKANKHTIISDINTFVDGAAIGKPGLKTF